MTVDLLRDVLTDEELATRTPAVMTGGVPGGALTTICLASGSWRVVDIAALDHLSEADRSDNHR